MFRLQKWMGFLKGEVQVPHIFRCRRGYFGEKGFTSQQLAIANKHHLNARHASFESKPEDIHFILGTRYPLSFLYFSQCVDLVAITGRGFKIKLLAGLLHFFYQRVNNLLIFAFQKQSYAGWITYKV